MVDYYKICYIAKYPDGRLLDPNKPYMEAKILASTKKEAISNLIMEFPGLKINVIEDPIHLQMKELK